MRALLHSDLELSGKTVTDLRLGVRYFLTPDAAWLFDQLRREPCVEILVSVVSRRQRIDTTAAKQAVYTLLGQLDVCGGVRLVWDGLVTRIIHTVVRSPWHHRYRGSLMGFVASMVQAYGLLVVVGGAAFAACRVVAGPTFSADWIWMPLGVLATCMVHEAGHGLAARWFGVNFVLLTRPWSAAIMYAQPPAGKDRIIAMCGPLAAMAMSALCAFFCHDPLVRCIWIAAGVIHACSLLPSMADGKTLWRNL